MINACVFDRRKVSWVGAGEGGEKWNYNTKYTYSETNKTVIVKVTWHRTRTGMHTPRKQLGMWMVEWGDPDNRHLEKDLTSAQTHSPRHYLSLVPVPAHHSPLILGDHIDPTTVQRIFLFCGLASLNHIRLIFDILVDSLNGFFNSVA